MRTLEYLAGPGAGLFWPGVVAGGAIALLCGALSVLVALKRMAFIGQGVSHAALGGVGIAAALGLGGAWATGVVGASCVVAALLIAWGWSSKRVTVDTAIGVVLVGSMALGAALLSWRLDHPVGGVRPPAWESLLFGSILQVRALDAVLAWAVGAAVVAALWTARRSMLFWAFDAPAAEAFGVSGARCRTLLLVLLAAAVVVSVKLAGVVLATALLVLPGATALRLGVGLRATFAGSVVVAVAGTGGGLVLAFEADLPPGACVVGALVGLFVLAAGADGVRSLRAGRFGEPGPAQGRRRGT